MADLRRPLHRAAAHLLLQQDGDETGHDAGGERERRQAAQSQLDRLHAVREQTVHMWRYARRAARRPVNVFLFLGVQ